MRSNGLYAMLSSGASCAMVPPQQPAVASSSAFSPLSPLPVSKAAIYWPSSMLRLRLTLPVSHKHSVEESQQIAPLLLGGGNDSQDTLDEATARRGGGAIAQLAPDDSMAQSPFDRIVGWLDALIASESPQDRPVPQQTPTGD